MPPDLASSSIPPCTIILLRLMGRIALHCMLSLSRLSLLCWPPLSSFPHSTRVTSHSVLRLSRTNSSSHDKSPTPLLAFPPQVSERRSSPNLEPFFSPTLCIILYLYLCFFFLLFSLFLPVVISFRIAWEVISFFWLAGLAIVSHVMSLIHSLA
ncbi:hypothetical protein BJX64DRAFT_54973 [Aspergillus heterothallicus]